MANSINGQSAISQDSHRRLAGIPANWFERTLGRGGGQILRADLSIDTSGDFDIDNPQTALSPASPDTGAQHRIYVVGWQMLLGSASTVTLKSAANTLITYNFAANGGVCIPVNPHSYITATNPGEKLVINFGSSPSPAAVFQIFYAIAIAPHPLVGR